MLPALHAETSCGAHGDRNSMLVSSAWLSDHLNDSDLVVISVSPKSDYDSGHIPGTRYLDHMETHTMESQGLTVELPPMAQLKEVFEKLGVSNQSRIVLYGSKDALPALTRVYLTLDSMGLGARASLLDGDLVAWQKDGRPVSKSVPAVAKGHLDLCPQNDVIAQISYVSANLRKGGVAIVDARAPQFYTGAAIPQKQRAGHIPGAANLPFNTFTESDGKWKSPDALRAMFQGAGVKPGDRVVSYCHIGMQATVVYFAARYLGYDARMYDGSWQDWSAHTELPAETSTGATSPGK
jgi:thiosulfate/3-mercaptopyruvate sulfurtransferase